MAATAPTLSSLSRSSLPRHALHPPMAAASYSSSGSGSGARAYGSGDALRLQVQEPSDASMSSLEIIGARRAILSRFESLRRPYKPFPLLGWNRHVETIFAAFFRSQPAVPLRRECLRTRDDGAVALDWVVGDDRQLPPDSPVLILLLSLGKIFNYVLSYSSSDSLNNLQFYSASFTEDLCQVVSHVSTRYPKSKIYAVGWSLGANILVRYLGEVKYSSFPFERLQLMIQLHHLEEFLGKKLR
ncbi:hypothetical protein B296_00046744 [Ensete ventricosum]|uniref:AB hydrolase-1 domain-containing protein n=1 Tax=Ensete ventricosum TaxID=4639 RepID=A0A426XGG1_ENSVE|nr:hypothetical protein B296_00046744 [Ensete ventricosum]